MHMPGLMLRNRTAVISLILLVVASACGHGGGGDDGGSNDNDSPPLTLEESRQFRAISGVSMGGYGAMNIGTKHPDIFGTIGSLGGPVDMTQLLARRRRGQSRGEATDDHPARRR